MKSALLISKLNFVSLCVIVIITCIFISLDIHAQPTQETIKIRGREYINKNNKYFVKYKNDSFELDTLTISIKYKPTTTQIQINNIEKAFKLKRRGPKNWINYYHYQCDSFWVSAKRNFLERFTTLSNLPDIDVAEINSYGRFLWTPNDPGYASQWHHDFIHMPEAWNITKGDNSVVVVGVIDSGTQWMHSDIGYGGDSFSNIFYNLGEDTWSNLSNPTTGNGIDDDNNGYIDDLIGWNFEANNNNVTDNFSLGGGAGHGTAVAGLISAKTNNNSLISGIAGGNNSVGVKVLPIKSGTQQPTSNAVIDAINYAITRGVDILNMSIALPPSTELNEAIDMAVGQGILVVAASGNEGTDVLLFPANNPKVIAVGNIQSDGFINNSSNYGPDLSVVAPGTDVVSTSNSNGTSTYTGTSFASPITAGVCALVKDVNECLTSDNIKDIVCMTADKVNSPNYDYYWYSERGLKSDVTGYGLINAYKAVNTANQMKKTGPDLYMKDQPWDFGIEPNPDGSELFLSEDIWVRNQQDGLLNRIHQTPTFTGTNPVYIYVRVRNKGCQPNLGEEQLKVYWSKANTALNWPNQWVNFYLNSLKHGDIVASAPKFLPVIQPGDEAIFEFEWWPPNPSDFINQYGSDAGHFCLLARIETSASSPFGMTTAETNSTPQNVKNNNNIIWKNITLVTNPGRKGRVFIGNPGTGSMITGLNFKINNGVYTGKVKLKLDSVLFSRWVAGGMSGNHVSVSNNIISLEDFSSSINNITLYTEEYFNIEFDFDSISTHHYDYFVLDLDQTYLSGGNTTYLGSERFLLNETYVEPQGGRLALLPANNTSTFGLEKDYLLYPNPVSSVLQVVEIKQKKNDNVPVKVFDQLGRLVYNTELVFVNGKASIDMQHFSKGVYTIVINSSYRCKVVK